MTKRTEETGHGISLILLGIIVLAGALLRSLGITTQGLLRWDEAHYFFTAYDIRDLSEFAKPLHGLIVKVGIALFGIADYSGKIMSAAFGIATIPVVYHFGRAVYDRKTGLLAAALLAFSYNHVYFSRLAHAQADSLFFLAVALYYYGIFRLLEKRELRRLAAAGLALAAAFMCHPNMAPFVIFFALLELCLCGWDTYRRGDVRGLLPAAAFGGVMAGALLIMEAFARVVTSASYLARIFFHAERAVQGVFNDSLFYARQIQSWDGTPKLVLTLLATGTFVLLIALRKIDRRDLFLLGFTLFPIVFWTVENSTADNDRNFTSLAVGLSLLLARFAALLTDLSRRKIASPTKTRRLLAGGVPLALLTALLVIFGQNIGSSIDFLKSPSPFKTFATQLSARLPGAVFAPKFTNPTLLFYLLAERKLVISDSLEEAVPGFRAGRARFFMVPVYPYQQARAGDAYYQGLVSRSSGLQKELSAGNSIRPVAQLGARGSYDFYLLYDLQPLLK